MVLNTTYFDVQDCRIRSGGELYINSYILRMIRASGTYTATIPENCKILNFYGSSLCEFRIK